MNDDDTTMCLACFEDGRHTRWAYRIEYTQNLYQCPECKTVFVVKK